MSQEETDCVKRTSEEASSTSSSSGSTLFYPPSFHASPLRGQALGPPLNDQNELSNQPQYAMPVQSHGDSQQYNLRQSSLSPPAVRPRVHSPVARGQSEVQRTGSQTMVAAASSPNYATLDFSEEKILIKCRNAKKPRDPTQVIKTKSKHLELKEDFIQLYHTIGVNDVEKIQMCKALVDLDVETKFRYDELNLQQLLDKNMVKRRMSCLVQTLGILEKYASNMIKPNRPSFWRTVKFTSSLVKTYLENVHGSHDVLMQMGYTKKVPDGLSFPDDVFHPDTGKIKILAADLFLAKYEIDELVHNRHPFLEIIPFVGSPELIDTKVPSAVAASEDSESEYEDAEDEFTSEPLNTNVQQNFSATDVSPKDDRICHVCGESGVTFHCEQCQDVFCPDCVKTFHKNRLRLNHKVSAIGSKVGDGKEKYSSSTSSDLYENIGGFGRGVKGPQPQPRTVKRPVPTPRKNIPVSPNMPLSKPHQNLAETRSVPGASQSNPPDELPPPPFIRKPYTVQPVAPNIEQQTSFAGSREIKRPPPFNQPSLSSEDIYESLKYPSDHLYETLDHLGDIAQGPNKAIVPPPLPPRPPPSQLPKLSEQTVTSPPSQLPKPGEQTVTSCPDCFCLNESNVTNCVACGVLLTKGQSTTGSPVQLMSKTSTTNSSANVMRSGSDSLPGQAFDNRTYGQQLPGMTGRPGSPVKMGTKWECQHCTFHNDMDTKICAMCSKTTDNPVEVASNSPEQSPASSRYNEGASTSPRPAQYDPGLQRSHEYNPGTSTTAANTPISPIKYNPMSPRLNQVDPSFSRSTPDPVSSQSSQFDPISPRSTSTTPLNYSKPMFTAQSYNEPSYKADLQELSPTYVELQRSEMDQIQGKSPMTNQPNYRSLQPTGIKQPENKVTLSPSGFTQTFQSCTDYRLGSSGSGSQEEKVISFLVQQENNEMKEAGEQFVKLMKEAETLGFTAEELNIAYNLNQDETKGPIYWLQSEWYDRIHQVMGEFIKVSQEDNYGNVSPEEARQALIEHTGVVKDACEKCVKDRKQKLTDILKSSVYIRTDIIKALDNNDGDVELSIQELQRISFEPMLERIKNSCAQDNVDNNIMLRLGAVRQISTTQDDEIFEALVSNKDIDMDRRIRVMFAEKSLISWGRAMTAIKLIDMEFPVSDSIEAANVNGDLERSIQFLQRECNICMETCSESRMIAMLNCQCRFCQPCVSQYFHQVIHEQNIMKLVCPQCGEPKNLEDDTEYFNHVDILIRRCVDIETHDLFQRKLRDRTLMTEPNFRWCSHCSSGFINEQPGILKMACPNCKKYTCFKCKKQWEDQHEGISCEQYAAWKEANDPEAQANGLAAHLKRNGIECPNCKFRYDLAKGGCMHFKCVQCNHEFCSGCYQPFRHNQHCPVSRSCAKRGLHAHHPRDCLFYLRDRDPKELMKLLDDNKVQYNTEPTQIQQQGEGEAAQGAVGGADTGRCKVMEQRETGSGLQDDECGRETSQGYAGLCRLHFIEYLVELINTNYIDPIQTLDIKDLKAILVRNDLEMPPKQNREKDKNYHTRIVKFIQEKLPLPKKSPRRRVLDIEDEIPSLQGAAVNNPLLDIEHRDNGGNVGLYEDLAYDSYDEGDVLEAELYSDSD